MHVQIYNVIKLINNINTYTYNTVFGKQPQPPFPKE